MSPTEASSNDLDFHAEHDTSSVKASPAVSPPPSGGHQTLRSIAAAFTSLHATLEASRDEGLSIQQFATACAEISSLFNMLGLAFAFGGRDYVQKVKDLHDASSNFNTLPAVMDHDTKMNTVKKQGSHTRNLLRIKRGLDLMRLLFQQLLEDSSRTLRECASHAYDAVFSPYHSWAIRNLVAAGMMMLPTKQQFLVLLKEDELTWRKPAQDFVEAVGPIIAHVESLFSERNITCNF